MPKFRKKPVVIEATQWFKNGDHPDDESVLVTTPPSTPLFSEGKVVRRFRRPDVPGDIQCSTCDRTHHDHGWIDTLEGGHIVCPGDFIITGVKGERYPCKLDIFWATYEPAHTVNQLFQIHDNGATFWVIAADYKRAEGLVKNVDGRDDFDDDPHVDYPITARNAKGLHFKFDDGTTCGILNAFELCRDHEQVLSCSEWP